MVEPFGAIADRHADASKDRNVYPDHLHVFKSTERVNHKRETRMIVTSVSKYDIKFP